MLTQEILVGIHVLHRQGKSIRSIAMLKYSWLICRKMTKNTQFPLKLM